jgi:hypothetical protein
MRGFSLIGSLLIKFRQAIESFQGLSRSFVGSAIVRVNHE